MKKTYVLTKLICLFLISFSLLISNTQISMSESSEFRELKEYIKKLEQRIEVLEQERDEDKKIVQEKVEEQDKKISSIGSYVDGRIQEFDIFPESKLFLSGYGAAGFENKDGEPSTFNALFAPIFHYQLGDNLHFVVEPEFSLEDDESNVELEIGEVHLFINDYLTLGAGKFMLPFNTFSERLHPTWINKMSDPPIIYGHGGHGEHGGSSGGIVPVLNDLGFQVRGGAPLPIADGAKINYAFYVVNGPRAIIEDELDENGDDDGDEHDEDGDEHADELILAKSEGDEIGAGSVDLVFGSNFDDINDNKTIGGRIGILPVWNLEIGTSFMYGEADDDIDFYLLGFDGSFQYKGLQLLGEFIRKENDLPGGGDEDVYGYYAQASYRLSGISVGNPLMSRLINGLEPIVRIGQIFQDDEEDIDQIAIGLDFWYLPSVPFKVAYQFNDGVPDSFSLQWAFGF